MVGLFGSARPGVVAAAVAAVWVTLDADFLTHPGWLAAGSGQGVRQGAVADRLLISARR
jgi:hypothetical protein